MIRPVLHTLDILTAVDAFHKRWRRWPNRDDGPVDGTTDLTWCGIDQALQKGHRGLRGGSSLAKFLHQHRGVRHQSLLPPLNHELILRWADAHHARTGKWPVWMSGKVVGVPGETWCGIDKSLRFGRRTLRGGSSLARLLDKRRGVRNNADVPRLTLKKVLAWADAHFQRTGKWPTRESGTIPEAPLETWAAVDGAFVAGARGLVGFGSLIRFLSKRRGVLNWRDRPNLTVNQVLAWARAFQKRTGKLPKHISGPIPESGGETWGSVHGALYQGRRGLPKSSLFQLLQKHLHKL
jgi:hypothetical protein